MSLLAAIWHVQGVVVWTSGRTGPRPGSPDGPGGGIKRRNKSESRQMCSDVSMKMMTPPPTLNRHDAAPLPLPPLSVFVQSIVVPTA